MTSNTPFGSAGWRIKPRRKSRTPRFLIVGAVVLLVAAVLYAAPALRELLWRGLGPVLSVRNALSHSEVAALRAQLAGLNARLADRDALYQENLKLKALLRRAAGRSATLAAILQRPPGVPYDTLVVDAGRNQGVLAGSLVSLGGSALVGSVTEVYADSARVTLYSAAGLVHEGLLLAGGKQVPVSVAGQGGGSMRAEVPAGTAAKAGDTVRLPGIGMGLTATVAHVESRAGESFETIYFALPADLAAPYVEIWQ